MIRIGEIFFPKLTAGLSGCFIENRSQRQTQEASSILILMCILKHLHVFQSEVTVREGEEKKEK